MHFAPDLSRRTMLSAVALNSMQASALVATPAVMRANAPAKASPTMYSIDNLKDLAKTQNPVSSARGANCILRRARVLA